MEQAQLLDILSAHADALNAGVDETETLLAAHPAAQSTLAPLLLLARQIKASLVPVAPATEFVADLGQALQAGKPAGQPLVGAATDRRSFPLGATVAAGLGSLVSVVGLLLLWRRRQRDGLVPA